MVVEANIATQDKWKFEILKQKMTDKTFVSPIKTKFMSRKKDDKLAQPERRYDTKRNTYDFEQMVMETPCTCPDKLKQYCRPLQPRALCARSKLIYATEYERNNTTYHPKINQENNRKDIRTFVINQHNIFYNRQKVLSIKIRIEFGG